MNKAIREATSPVDLGVCARLCVCVYVCVRERERNGATAYHEIAALKT